MQWQIQPFQNSLSLLEIPTERGIMQCVETYDPSSLLPGPTAQIAVMSGICGRKTLLQIRVNALKSQGKRNIERRGGKSIKGNNGSLQ
jgi:hypothetical protein